MDDSLGNVHKFDWTILPSTITVAHTISTHPFMSGPKRVLNKFMSNVTSKPTH